MKTRYHLASQSEPSRGAMNSIPIVKRRWPLFLFLFCWLLVLLTPPLRRMFSIQLTGRSEVYRAWFYGPMPASSWSPSPDKLSQQFPDDPRVLSVALEANAGYKDAAQRKTLRQYDALIARFPREKWLLARRLVRTIEWMHTTRLGGEFSDPNRQTNKALGIPSPERPTTPPNFTPQDWQIALNMAQLGARREPDNAFYDWVQFYLLMMNWQDAKAWKILSRASHKKNYDKHVREWAKAQITVRELELGRPLLWEEIQSATSKPIFGIDSKERELARIVEWEGLKAGRRRGNHQKALQIYCDFARLQNLHARHSYDVIESLVAKALIALSLGVEGKAIRAELKPAERDVMEAWARLSAAKFSRYATKHGRPDLAREMSKLRIENGREQDLIRAKIRNLNLFYGLPSRPFINSLALWWAADILLLLLTLLLFLWIVLGGTLRVLTIPSPIVARRDGVPTVLLGVLSALICFGVPLLLGLGWRTSYLMGGEATGLAKNGEALSAFFIAGVVAPPLLISFWCWTATRRRAYQSEPRQSEPRQSELHQKAPRFFEKLREMRLAPLAGSLALQIWTFGALLWWFHDGAEVSLPYVITDLFPSFSIAPIDQTWPLIGFALGLLTIWLRPIFSASVSEKPFVAYRLRWIHQTLGALLLLGSVAYIALGLWAQPSRRAADANMKLLVQRGEMALRRENIAP